MVSMTARRRVQTTLVAWSVGAGILRLSLWAPEVCPSLTAAEARAAAVDAAGWIVANQSPDGEYLYAWDREAGGAVDDYNLVRHAGVTMSLYQLADAGELALVEPADRGLDWMLDRLRPTVTATGEPAQAFSGDRTAKLGAAALLAVSLAQRRLATGDRRHDETMVEVGRFLAGQQRLDGSMLDRYSFADDAPVPDATSIYSTGEALWALALIHEALPSAGFASAAWATLDYLALDRDRVEGYAPAPWPDQWAAYSLAEMAEWGLDDHHIDYARGLLGRYAGIVRFDAQRGTAYGSLTHGPVPRGSGVGTWIEGLAALRTLTADPRLADLAEPTAETLACGAARLAERQVAPGPDVPPEEAGAWFHAGETRMDDQQHAASGLLGAEPVLP